MEVVRHGVIVVGTGCAGLRAALAASHESDASVVCIGKDHGLYAGGIGSAGGVNAALDDADADAFAYETTEAGEFLADQLAVDALVAEAEGELAYLAQLGCPWARDETGAPRRRKLAGASRARAWFVQDRTASQARRTLLYAALGRPSIQWLHEYAVTRLLVEDNQVYGVAALNLRTGQLKSVLGRAVVLASGGASQVYELNTGGGGETGDGIALAYRAGAVLSDLEFVQYHPTGMVPIGAVLTEALRSEGGQLLNGRRERFLDATGGEPGELARRDRVVRAMYQEVVAQRADSGAHGPALLLDLRELDAGRLAREMPSFCELADRYGTERYPRVAVRVRPAVHGIAGGVVASPDGQTSIGGLYAAGDVASGVHGANVLGGSSLSAALVQGRRAGRSAMRHAADAADPRQSTSVDQATAESARLDRLRARRPTESAHAIRCELAHAMEQGCGPFRDARGLRACLRDIGLLKERYAKVGMRDRSSVFNLELVRAIELRNLLDVAEVIVSAALARTESRGSHFRSDFRERDDASFLKNAQVRYQTAGPDIRFVPVPLKRWTPEERLA